MDHPATVGRSAKYLGRDGVLIVREHPEVSRSSLVWEVEKLGLVRALPGGYLHPSVAGRMLAWMDVVCRVHPEAVLVRGAARDVAEALRGAPLRGPIPVAASEHLRGGAPYVFFRRRVPAAHVLCGGALRWTDPVYTAVDLLPADAGAAACDLLRAAGRRGPALLAELRDVSARMRRFPDQVQRTRLLGDLQRCPWSVLELEIHRLLLAHGITGWSANHRVVLGGRELFVDIAFPGVKVSVEADGREYHSDGPAFENDRVRWNLLSADGWIVLRITWDMVKNRPDLVVHQVRAALASRSADCALY